MTTTNNQRPIISPFYSGEDDHAFNDVPLRDLRPNSEYPTSGRRSLDWALYRAKQEQDSKNRRTIRVLIILMALLAAATAVIGTIYGIEKAQPPHVLTKTAIHVSTSTITTTRTQHVTETTTTSFPTKIETAIRTETLPPLTTTLLQTITTPLTVFHTETLPPITQTTTTTTTQNQTETSLVTSIITTILNFTTTQTTTLSFTSSTTGPPNEQHCTVDYEYGGNELHRLNPDYDLLMIDALERAVGKGLDYGALDPLTVAMRSIFECVVTDVLELVDACRSGYVHDIGGIYCNSMGSYTTQSVTVSTATGT